PPGSDLRRGCDFPHSLRRPTRRASPRASPRCWLGVWLLRYVTVTSAVPLTLPLVARMVALPVRLGALYRPVLLIEPMPPASIDQVKAGCVTRAPPNWSKAVAVNCFVVFLGTVAVAGETWMLVST